MDFFAIVVTSVYFLIFILTLLLALVIRRGYVSLKLVALGTLSYSRHFSVDGVFEGGEVELIEEVKNDSFFPLFFVRLDFYAPDGLVVDGLFCRGQMKLTSVFNILPRSTVTKTHRVGAVRRDHYVLETVSIKYRKNIFDFNAPAELYVYPGKFRAPAFREPDILRSGEAHSLWRGVEDRFFVSGVRDYRYGDPMRNINFKATARASSGGSYRLMSSSYDSSRDFGAMIFLDLTPYPEVTSEPADSERLLENGLSSACYIFGETVAGGGRVGFAANAAVGGKRYIFRPPGSGRGHIKEILESFAEITYFKRRDYSFNALVRQLAPEIRLDIDIYILTPFPDEALSRTVTELGRRRGVSLVRFGADERPDAREEA